MDASTKIVIKWMGTENGGEWNQCELRAKRSKSTLDTTFVKSLNTAQGMFLGMFHQHLFTLFFHLALLFRCTARKKILFKLRLNLVIKQLQQQHRPTYWIKPDIVDRGTILSRLMCAAKRQSWCWSWHEGDVLRSPPVLRPSSSQQQSLPRSSLDC